MCTSTTGFLDVLHWCLRACQLSLNHTQNNAPCGEPNCVTAREPHSLFLSLLLSLVSDKSDDLFRSRSMLHKSRLIDIYISLEEKVTLTSPSPTSSPLMHNSICLQRVDQILLEPKIATKVKRIKHTNVTRKRKKRNKKFRKQR